MSAETIAELRAARAAAVREGNIGEYMSAAARIERRLAADRPRYPFGSEGARLALLLDERDVPAWDAEIGWLDLAERVALVFERCDDAENRAASTEGERDDARAALAAEVS
jgi:hypothetical protein